jgi:organic radical activating enzyme
MNYLCILNYKNVIKRNTVRVNSNASINGRVLYYSRRRFSYGTAAYFVRIGGVMCCHWCDVKESWNAELHPSSINQINAKKYSETVWWGEPLMWDMTLLTQTR